MTKQIVIITVFFVSCNHQYINNKDQLKQQMIAADKSMSDMAAKDGFNNSILFYADSNIVKLGTNKLPVIGKAAFAASFDKDNDVKTISWRAVNAEVAASGDLGFTWGNWKFIAEDTTFYGNYFTAWKRHPDGSWKVLLDGGNNTPALE